MRDSDIDRIVEESRRRSTINKELAPLDVIEQVVRLQYPLANIDELQELINTVAGKLFGLGIVAKLLSDETVSDICINGPGHIWVERAGELSNTNISISESEIRQLIDRIVVPVGARADRLASIVDTRLITGERVHITMPPIAIDGPYIAIRRHLLAELSLNDFGDFEIVDKLGTAVTRRMNIVVCGGTGAGKTTLLRALSSWFQDSERVVLIEDTAELQLPSKNLARLEARSANAEGIGQVTMRELVRASLRLRPDRIVFGEVRGGEAFDMVQALNTGHAGSLSTIHANSIQSGMQRLITLCMLGESGLPHEAASRLVESAVDIFVFVERDQGHRRRISQLYDVRTNELWVKSDVGLGDNDLR